MRSLRILSIVVLLLVAIAPANAGKIKVKERAGAVHKNKGRFLIDIYRDGKEFWTLAGTKSGEYYVSRYDQNMNFVNGKKIFFDYYGKFLDVEEVVRFRGEYYFFLSYENLKTNKTYLFYTLFDVDGLITESDLVKVGEIKSGSKKTTSPSFHIEPSEDENKLIIMGIPPRNLNIKRKMLIFKTVNPSKSSSFAFWVLDKDMKIINHRKKHKITIDETSDKFAVKEFKVANDGTVYILGKNERIDQITDPVKAEGRKSKGKRSSSKDWSEYESSAFVLEQLAPNGDIAYFTTNTETLYSDMSILINDDKGKLGLMGLVGESAANTIVTTGVEFIELDTATMEMTNSLIENFTEEVLDKVNAIRQAEDDMNKRQKKRKSRREARMSKEQRELSELMKRAALNMNTIAYCGYDALGVPVLILEERWVHVVVTTTYNSNGTSTTKTTYYYHYDDLIIVKFDEDEVIQKPFVKSFVSVDYRLPTPLSVVSKNEYVYIMTASHIIRAESFMDEFDVHDLAPKRRRSLPRSIRKFGSVYAYKKSLKDGTIVALKQRGAKMFWTKLEVD